jgi:hypothetical protein
MPAITAEAVATSEAGYKLYPKHLLDSGTIQKNKLIDYSNFSDHLVFDNYEIVSEEQHGLDRHYAVPLYVTSRRGHVPPRANEGFVTNMIFKIDKSTDRQFWTKRALALVCLVDH